MFRTINKITYAYLIGLDDDGYVSFKKASPRHANLPGPTRERMLREADKHARNARGFIRRHIASIGLVGMSSMLLVQFLIRFVKDDRWGEALFAVVLFLVFWLAMGPRVLGWYQRWLIRQRLSRLRCLRCKYDLSRVPEDHGWIICPECGLDVPGASFGGLPSPVDGPARAQRSGGGGDS